MNECNKTYTEDKNKRHFNACDDEEDSDDRDEEESILHALHFAVGNICRQEEQNDDKLEEEEEEEEDNPDNAPFKKLKMSKSSIRTLTQMTYHYATKCLSKDLVAFSKHANRKTITVDDVKLVARKNPRGLLDALEGFCENTSEFHKREQKRNDIIMGNGTATVRDRRSVDKIMLVGIENESDSDDSSTDSLLENEKHRRRKQSSDSSEVGIQVNIRESSSTSSAGTSKSSRSCSSDNSVLPRKKRVNIRSASARCAIDLLNSESE